MRRARCLVAKLPRSDIIPRPRVPGVTSDIQQYIHSTVVYAFSNNKNPRECKTLECITQTNQHFNTM